MRPANQLSVTGSALCHKLIGDPWYRSGSGDFMFWISFLPPPFSCHAFLFCVRLLVSFPCAYFRITPFVLVYFVHQLLERCFSYQFFFLRSCVSSFPSRAPFFISLVLLSFCPFPHPLSSHLNFPFVSHSLSFTYQFRARSTGHKHELRSSPRAHVFCSQGPFPHSLLSSLTVDRASTSHKFPVC